MQQEANPQTQVFGTYARRQLTACLRLSRGASAQATWLLEDVPGGTTIQIGADVTCDWQIRAASVPEQALTVMLVGGTLFMKSAQEGAVLLDGKPLARQWTEVSSGARVDIGLSRIEVAIGEASSAFGQLPQAYVPSAMPPELSEQPERTPAPTGAWHDSVERGDATTFAEITQPQHELRESLVPRAVLRPRDSQLPESGRPSLVERLSRPSMLEGGAPSLLDERMSETNSAGLWKFAMGGLLTALAYGGWLVLLDHL